MAQKFLSSLRLANLSSDPSTASAGDLYYNTVSNAVKFYNGSVWSAVSSSAGSGTVTSITAGTGLTGGTISSSGTIAIDTAVVPRLGVTNTFTANQIISGSLTATTIIKSGGTSVEFLKADGSVDSFTTLFITSSAEITPLDSLKLEFDGRESRFIPKYQGQQVYIGNPHRVEIMVNGLQQPLDFMEYVWGTPFMRDGFTIDSDGFIAFSEVPPAGATFSGKIVAGSPTSTLDNRYPFKAADILLGAY